MTRTVALFMLMIWTFGAVAGDRPFRLHPRLSENDYTKGKIIFKVKPQFRYACERTAIYLPSLNNMFARLGTGSLQRKFPRHEPPAQHVNGRGQRLADLSLIYELNYGSGLPIEKAINTLLADPAIEYAEPEYHMQPLYVPNDTLIANQYHLASVRAFQGWDISKGDSSIVIGITDTGTDPDHPDLVNQVKYNYADPVNGVDDDNDGYTDNFAGWDLGDNDNDPTCGNSLYHGSFTTGFSSATVDNVTGVAGTGFHCKYLPVKISSGGTLNKAYDGIVYAADHGCQIINCSWGSFGGGSFGQDVIDYATINMGRLVIGAAGNADNSDLFYPASYKYVLSVAGTDSTDGKWFDSSYGCTVDVCAPADKVYGTVFDDTYTTSSGTSFASPMVAGIAGLVMWQFPAYTPLQVAEQVRVTADPIDTVPGNAPYAYHLGRGRVNMFRALTETSAISVRMEDIAITDGNDEAFAANDTLSITSDIINWLNPVSNLTLTLTSNSPDVNILDSVVTIGAMASLATTNNNNDPFLVEISPSVPLNAQVEFRIMISDGAGYDDFQCLRLVLNVDYINVLVNDVGTSITSRGRIGYNAPNQSQGIGFTYDDGSSILFEGSLLVGDGGSRVSDQMFGDPVSVNDTDFVSIENVRLLDPSAQSDFDLYSRFNDDGAAGNKLEVTVTQRTYAWSNPADARYIIVYYTFRNDGTVPLSNLYAGIYADWDIGPSVVNNRAATDGALKMGYAWEDAPGGTYAGVKVLGSAPYNVYAVDNNGSNGSLGIYDGFTKPEKYMAMGTPRAMAGTSGAGGDVSVMTASGPHGILPGDSIRLGFALLAADSLPGLQAAAQAAEVKFLSITGIAQPEVIPFHLSEAYPNPAPAQAVFTLSLREPGEVVMEVIDARGRVVDVAQDGFLAAGMHTIRVQTLLLAEGIYIARLQAGRHVEARTLVIAR